MANLKTEIILSMNGKAAIQVLEALRDKAKAVREEIDNLDKKAPDFKEQKAGLEKVYDALQSAHENIIKDTERLDTAIQNLSSTSLQNLRKALGDGRRELQKLSEDELEKADEIRKKMKLVGDEIRLLEGQYVKIADGLKNVSNQSDQWLDKAIKQQRDLVGSLQKSDAEYQKNLSILKQLEAEEDRRRGKMSKNDAMATVSNKYANASELRRAKTTITEVRDKTDSHKVDEIEKYNKALQEIDKRLASISGQFIDIQKGIGNVSNQSDQWLDKALKQQRDLVGSLQKSDASYQQNLATLKQLEDEEDRRKGKMSVTEARQTVSNSNASASDLRRAKTTLTEARDNTPTGNSSDIAKYNSELQEIEKRLEAVSGKAQKVAMSWNEAKQVLAAPNKATGEDIKRAMEVIAQKIQQLPAGSKYVADLRRQYSMLEQTLKGTRMSQSALNDILARSKQGKASLDELRRAYKQLEEELNQISTKSKEFADKQKSMKELKKNIDEVTGAANKQGGVWKTAMKNLTAYIGLFSLFNKAKELVTGAIKKNFEYSGSLTDIRKISGMTMQDVKKLSTELAKIDTRTSVDGLAQLAYQGAKLGMSKYGVEGMTQFVKAADKINVAIGEEMGDEALPALSKMVEVMGLIPKLGIEKALDATGSAIFKLSTSSTSVASDIVEFSKRLTGVARTAGITTDQLLALGSASSSMMLMPEVSSTAMGKFIAALQRNHNLIAKELGIPDETIKNLYASGHAMDAIVLVLEKMRDKGNMNALGGIFKDLGSDGQRLVTAMVTMSKNVDMLKDHLYESEEAFREATAVTKEYEMQQQSAIGILERANNLWEKAFINPDGVDAVKGMAEWWYEMSQTMTSSPILKGTLLIALQSVLWALRAVATLLPVIIGYIASQGLYSGFRLLVQYGAAFGSAVKQMYAYVTAARTATVAQTGLNSAMKLNPWIALASVVVAVAGAVYGYAQQAKEAARSEMEAAKKANEWKNNLKEAQSETDTTTRKLHSYKVAMEKLNLSETERRRQISQFNRDFRQYISKLGIEIKSVDDLRKNYKALAEEIQRATYYRLREKAKEDAMPKFQADRLSAENRIKTELNKYQSRGSGFTSKGVMEMFAKGASADWIYRQIIKGDRIDVDGKGINFEGTTGRYSYTRKDGATIKSGGDQGLLSALRHFRNATIRERNKEKEINDYFGDFVPEDYTPWVEETPGTLENNAPDKEAIKQAKRDKLDRERAWREELKQKQDEANAIMDNVRNFYERQINAKMQEAIGLGMDKTEQDLFVEPVKRRMNEALEQVRLAIAGQANTWEQFKLTMRNDLIEQTDETGVNLSEGLLKGITSNNIDALREKLNELGNSLNRPLNSILAEVFAKATKNAQANLKLETQQQEARRKAIQEHDYTGVVQQSAYDDFNLLGYANPTDAEVKDKAAFDKRKANIIAMFEKAREEITKVFSADVSTEEGRGLLLQLLFGDDPDGMGKRIAKTLGNDAKEWQAFYQKLIQYNDEYESASKKRDDKRKKLNDYGWNSQGFQAEQDNRRRAMQQVGNGVERFRKAGKGEDSVAPRSGEMGGSKFMDEFSYNANIEQSKLEIILIQEKIAWLQKMNATSEQVAELQKSLAEKQDSYILSLMQTMKQRTEAIYALYKPLEDFGTAAGQAFATMTEDAEAGRDAFKAAIGDMINSMMKQTVQMTQEYIKRRLMQKVNDKLVSAQIKKSTKEQISLEQGGADATSAITKAAGDAKVMLTEQVGQQVVNAVTTQTQTTTATAQSAAATDVSTQAAKTEANVGLGIAEGSAKTIGSLGWWGIPLIAVITAVLNGLLGFAMGKVSSLFGKGNESNTNTSTKNTKIVSGMLTYDSGNVQDLRPFVSNDGSLYWATEDSKPHNGVSLLTQPTATTINGQPSLVAENGPELVIGRETTRAMMMNNPQLMKALVNYDRNYSGRRAYDTGNIAEAGPTIAAGATVSDEMTIAQANTNVALLQAVETLLQRLEQPIEAKIDMYGHGKLYDSMTKANQFMKNK